MIQIKTLHVALIKGRDPIIFGAGVWGARGGRSDETNKRQSVKN